MKNNRIIKIIVNLILAMIVFVYIAALLRVVLFKNGVDSDIRGITLVPFGFVRDFISHTVTLDVWLKNVAGNIAVFVPMGILLPLYLREMTPVRTILTGFATSFSIEVIQYLAAFGLTDIDDLMLNTVGTALGVGIYYWILRRIKDNGMRKFVVAVGLSVFGICGVAALWMYQPSMLPTQTAYEGQEILADLGPDTYDATMMSTGIRDEYLLIIKGSVQKSEIAQRSFNNAQNATTCKMADNVRIYGEVYSYQYSPNGNIQKTTVTYQWMDAVTVAGWMAGSPDGTAQVRVWLNEAGECETVMFTFYEN